MGLPELLRVHKSILDHIMFINFVYRLRYSWSIPVTILYTDNEYVSSVLRCRGREKNWTRFNVVKARYSITFDTVNDDRKVMRKTKKIRYKSSNPTLVFKSD